MSNPENPKHGKKKTVNECIKIIHDHVTICEEAFKGVKDNGAPDEEPYVGSVDGPGSGLYGPKSDWLKYHDSIEALNESGIHDDGIDHMANLIKEAVDADIISLLIDQARQKFRVMRMGDETRLMEWNGESWVTKCVMLGDFDFTLEPDWGDTAK